jgi:hypothetical protein
MYFEEIGNEKKIHGVKVVPAQTPCEVVNVLPSLQFEREENPCAPCQERSETKLVLSEAKT